MKKVAAELNFLKSFWIGGENFFVKIIAKASAALFFKLKVLLKMNGDK